MYEIGDFILTYNKGLVPNLIRFGQRLKYKSSDTAKWNHAAIIVSQDGDIIEAMSRGIRRSHISAYGEKVIVDSAASPADRAQMVQFANYCADTREKYGFVTFISIAVTLLSRLRMQVSTKHTHICSGLVADALTRSGVIWDQSPDFVMPADLAKKFNL